MYKDQIPSDGVLVCVVFTLVNANANKFKCRLGFNPDPALHLALCVAYIQNLTGFYEAHNPEKASLVSVFLKKFSGKEVR